MTFFGLDPLAVNTQTIKQLAKNYGPGITVSTGKVHDYLSMDLDFTGHKNVKVSMIRGSSPKNVVF